MKRRWLRIIANKERNYMEEQRELRNKFEKQTKADKTKKKRMEGEQEDRKMIGDMKAEKQLTVRKKRDLLQNEFDKSLRAREEDYKKRLTSLLSSKQKTRPQEADFSGSKGHSSKIASDLADSRVMGKERPKTTLAKHHRALSSHHESVSYFEED